MGLPGPVLLRRVRNDLEAVGSDLGLDVPEIGDDAGFPLELPVTVKGVEGYSAPGVPVSEHRFTLVIGAEYPYERPRVRWNSPIFHPNIMSPEEGGTVCVMQIDHWDFDSDLSGFIYALTDLIKNPNPHDPLRSPTCQAASEWFLANM